MGERLEPCPFCGGVPETVDATRILGIWRIVHRCDVLGCVSVGREDIKDAAVEWNRRAASPDAARVATLERELAAMREALDDVEWSGNRDGSTWICPSCGGVRGDGGHAPGCKLAASLAGRSGT
jgi:hypothetical protein